MSVAARLNRRLTDLAVGRHLPYRTARARLTLLYGGLFLLSGAALMAIAYALLVNAGFVFSLQSGPVSGPRAGVARAGADPAFPGPGSSGHPSARTMAHWRAVARCMRDHGVPHFPEPRTSVPPSFAGIGQVQILDGLSLAASPHRTPSQVAMLSDRDGAILVFPASLNLASPAFTKASATCGFVSGAPAAATAQENRRRAQVRQQLLIQSGIALAGMSLLSLGLGWLMAGRVLEPLETSVQAQRQFVANASHELRAPLTRLRALSEVALASPEANFESLRRAHERALASEQHLEQLIDGLLALTRGQAGLERRERLDLATLASQALAPRQPELVGLDVHADLAGAPTDGDPRLVERLITNLIDNAIQHNIPGGRIELATGTRDRHAYLAIANTGGPIAPEEIQSLFEPFHRLGGARTRHDGGHGLGLSIVQAIADAHRAELTARGRPEGGLTIEVVFPPPLGAGSRMPFARRQPVIIAGSDGAADRRTRGWIRRA